tara:strand:+ start:43 stop:723 length:681 start_codon:yes stop_codon:yes gene_type:complete
MAISVDTVYQTVLALANKEQRGYVTPQEFNLFAIQAQMEIFNQYFYDLNRAIRIPGNQSDYADDNGILQDKISIFIETSAYNAGDDQLLPEDFYRVSLVTVDGNTAEKTSREQQEMYKSPLTTPTKSRPIFYVRGNAFSVRPSADVETIISYIRKPKNPKWSYVIINKKALWNPDAPDKQDFELNPEEQTNLVIKILKLAGVSIKDYNLAQSAGQEEVKNIQQQKS